MSWQANDSLKRWIAALESEDYKQTTSQLTNRDPGDDDPMYCCLGVACDLYAADDNDSYWQDTNFVCGEEVFETLAPKKVICALGIEPIQQQEGTNVMLQGITASEWNDSKNASFIEIAAMLRAEYGLVGVDLTAYYTPREATA